MKKYTLALSIAAWWGVRMIHSQCLLLFMSVPFPCSADRCDCYRHTSWGRCQETQRWARRFKLTWSPTHCLLTFTFRLSPGLNASEKQSEVNSKQAEYDTASAQLAGLKEIQTRFESLEVSINTITDSLGELSTVWHWVLLKESNFLIFFTDMYHSVSPRSGRFCEIS